MLSKLLGEIQGFVGVVLLAVARFLRIASKTLHRQGKKMYRHTHHHVARRPHEHLMSRSDTYARWHNWDHHRKVHFATLGIYIVVIVTSLVFSYRNVLAVSNLIENWNFADTNDYTFDASAVEQDGTSARLKAQNYATDANTMALYHLDETSGTNAADASSNANEATLQADSWNTGNLNNAVSLNGTSNFLSAPDSASLSVTGSHTIEGWAKFSSTFNTDASQDHGIVDKGSYRLYYDRTSGKINYEIANASATSWTKQAGGDTNSSWDFDGKTIVRSTTIHSSNTYVGLGLGTGDAEVWKWNGSTWSQIGGDGVNSSWADQQFEDVNTLATNGNTLYAGLGTNAAGDAEVWSCDLANNCSDWTKIGGDGVNSGWAINTYEAVTSMTVFGGNMYAGVGVSANDAEVWRWNGSTWTKIGGDSLASGWTTNFEAVRSLTNDGTNLYAGLGDTAQDAEVWRYNGTSWTLIGGDGANSSWSAASNIEQVLSLSYFGGNLYAGVGLTAGDGDVWRYNGTSWTQIGGDGLNSGWAASTYEVVPALANDGTNLYAGVGNSNGDGEVFRWNGSAWTKIGGDGVNSGFSANQGDGVYALEYSGSTLYAGLYDAAGNGTIWTYNGSIWSWHGGGYVNASWGGYNLQSVESTATHNEKLYAGTGVTVAGNALVWEFNGTSWQIIGGQGIRGSWTADTFENVYVLQSYKGELYAGLGSTANDAEVWKYNGSTWTKIGGDSINSGWTTNYEAVNVMAVWGGDLYAGLGISAQDAEVWRYNGTSWTKVGGDGVNSSWAAAGNIESVLSMTLYNGNLYAGLGTSAADADIWRFNGTSWTQVGGDGLGSSWSAAYEEVYIMRVYANQLVVGLGNGTDDAEVWNYNGTTWTKIGGDDVNGSWTSGTYERVRSMAIYNGKLYVGIGDTAGDGEVWEWNGTSWTQIGGDNLNSGWNNTIEYVSSLIDYKGKLYAGTGFTANADAAMYSYGNNAFLSSTQSSQDTNWHHIAATYNGSTMKLYIDGTEDASTAASLTIPDNSSPLLIGSTYGSGGRGETQGYFNGLLDEVRISNTARTTFTTKPYTTSKQLLTLNDPAYTTGVETIDTFAVNETLSGGTIEYRISNDDGANWKFWDGDSWENATTENDSSTATEINDNIDSLPVTFNGVRWQAVISSDGNQRVALNTVTIEATSDTVDPATNASSILAYKANGGSQITSNAWTNGSSPYFSWTAGADANSGILGYCLYLGQDNSADPATTKGLLGTSPVDSGGACQFAVSGTSIDLSTSGYLGSALSSSNTPYYLLVRAIDRAGNMFNSSETFQFRFDNTAPSNPGFITAPSGFINTKEATLTWATTGGQAAGDANSGVDGLQYKINNTTWYGDSHTGTGDTSDLLTNDGSYQTIPTPDHNNIIEGINTVYFRTWDQAGNVTTSYVTAALKVNTNGAPSEPLNLSASPSTNTANSFAFSWDLPNTYVGDANNLSYCYTVNALPNVSNCSYTTTKALSSGPYATQPGENILYVAARDESSNINYANYSSVSFTANTPSPGIATNVDIVDVSIKSTSNWRLALTWEPPVDTGAGVSNYKVYRSTNNATFTFVGSSTSTTYIDANLSQQTYYYYVRACDTTNNCSANSSTVSLLPTGKFTNPASLTSDPDANNITTKRARITWTTDRASDSKVAIGTKSGQYSPSEVGSSDQVTSHAIDLDNLSAGTTYYYIVKWTDEDGNTGTSQEFTFTTSPAPLFKEVETTKVGLSTAIVSFTTKGATRISLFYGTSESFGGVQSINTSVAESRYSIEMTGLSDGTKYYYALSAFDSENNEYQSNIFSFTTPPRPRINNLRFQPVAGEPTSTQEITWATNVPSTSTITYGVVGSNGIDVQDSLLKTDHKIVIRGLQDDSRYFIIAQSRDADGNLAVSDRQEFRTALDTRPPQVSEISIEQSIRGTGAEARGQIIVSWKTDEPSSSQVGYAEGSDATVFNNRSTEDTQLTTEHIVVISDLPTSRVYSIQPISRDKAGNPGTGTPESAIIGRASESVLTVIFNTLQKVFGL
jgi:hypothetical protein